MKCKILQVALIITALCILPSLTYAHGGEDADVSTEELKAIELIPAPAMTEPPIDPKTLAAKKIAQQTSIEEQNSSEPSLTDTISSDQMAMPAELLPPEDFYVAEVQKVLQEGTTEEMGVVSPWQELSLVIKTGNEKGKAIHIEYGKMVTIREDQKLQSGESAVVAKTVSEDGEAAYSIRDRYRLPPLILITILFFGLVIIFGGKKGIGSILGLVVTFFVLTGFIVPGIFNGGNPLLYTVTGSFVICTLTLYLAHGFNRQTSIALVSTLVTLTLAAILATIFVNLTHLTGAGSEEAYYLTLFGSLENLNLKGLLLGGILIGALGVLDDVTTSQATAIHEIHKADPRLDYKDLYKRGLIVGREHIASLVNTLVLAYAGSSLPLLLIFTNADQSFLWTDINSEFMVEEIVRTLVGSTALVLAVPIVTLLAAYTYTYKKNTAKGS